ncbi:MAG TPA: hypothetical protein VK184_18200 [Nostocaceae cyanobacterium]|nr:hypothetical protein [Nostocaceae cyanobacterium]
MITEEELAQQFNTIIQQCHPRAWKLLRYCYVKIVNPYLMRLGVSPSLSSAIDVRYVVVYCHQKIFTSVAVEKDLLREVAKYLGLTEVVCFDASRILRDPQSIIKEYHPQLWLELIWIATQEISS